MNDRFADTGYFAPWTPKEFGTPKATAVAVLIVVLIVSGLVGAYEIFLPKPQPPVIQITQAQLTQLPKPTPPPPPKVVPPPKPIPAVIPKPPPVESKIVVATKPPPPQHHVFKPVAHPVEHPVPPTPVAHPTPPAPAPVAPTNGIPIYGHSIYEILQANQSVPPALAALGVSGTAIVQILVAPDGHVLSARIATSSGNSLIDATALDHALHASFGAFNADMPQVPHSFTVPVEIDAESDN